MFLPRKGAGDALWQALPEATDRPTDMKPKDCLA